MFPENAPAVRLFVACQTQWRCGPDGGALGLDYAGIAAGAAMMGVTVDSDLFGRVRVLEGEALRLMREAREGDDDG